MTCLAIEQRIGVWCVPLDDSVAPQISDVLPLLSDHERQRFGTFAVARRARQYALAHAALRLILGGVLGQRAEAVSIIQSAQGKPMLPASPWQFSMAHSGELAMIALAGHKVGIDLERVHTLRNVTRLAERILSDEEQRQWSATSTRHQNEELLRIWTCKEAILKAAGHGLRVPMHSVHVGVNGEGQGYFCGMTWFLHEVPTNGDYVATVASAQLALVDIEEFTWAARS